METTSVRINDRDLKIFDFLAMFGYATIEQLLKYTGGGNLRWLTTRLRNLVNEGYLVQHRILHAKPGVYTITKKANRTSLGEIKNIDISDYHHDLLVIDVFLQLQHKFANYITERMIRTDRGVGAGKYGRIPDLAAYTTDGKSIALELDRTAKSLQRLEKIVDSYVADARYDEVWFICATGFIRNNIEKLAWSEKIKVFSLENVLSGTELVHITQNFTPRMDTETERIIGKFFR